MWSQDAKTFNSPTFEITCIDRLSFVLGAVRNNRQSGRGDSVLKTVQQFGSKLWNTLPLADKLNLLLWGGGGSLD